MAIKLKVPNPNFNGVRGGVKFEKGVGVFEDEKLGREVAASLGYEIIEDKKPTEKKTTSAKKTATKKTTAKK